MSVSCGSNTEIGDSAERSSISDKVVEAWMAGVADDLTDGQHRRAAASPWPFRYSYPPGFLVLRCLSRPLGSELEKHSIAATQVTGVR